MWTDDASSGYGNYRLRVWKAVRSFFFKFRTAFRLYAKSSLIAMVLESLLKTWIVPVINESKVSSKYTCFEHETVLIFNQYSQTRPNQTGFKGSQRNRSWTYLKREGGQCVVLESRYHRRGYQEIQVERCMDLGHCILNFSKTLMTNVEMRSAAWMSFSGMSTVCLCRQAVAYENGSPLSFHDFTCDDIWGSVSVLRISHWGHAASNNQAMECQVCKSGLKEPWIFAHRKGDS